MADSNDVRGNTGGRTSSGDGPSGDVPPVDPAPRVPRTGRNTHNHRARRASRAAPFPWTNDLVPAAPWDWQRNIDGVRRALRFLCDVRTWDLKSAYKQLAVKREHKRFALICVVDPESNRVRIAEIHSMPFGAAAAVHAFLRCGEGIKAIGRGKLRLVMTNFFDDFTVLASRANCKHVQLVVSFLFRKLGWDVAPEEKKNAPFAEVFDVLGVRVDLCKQQEGKVSIKNTPDRLAELQADVSRILENGSISYEESQRRRGRFLFAEQNVWGRNSRQAIVAVGDVPDTEQGPVKLSHTQVAALQFLQKRVLDGQPRQFSVVPRPTTRDGACEWDHGQEAPICGFGGVLLKAARHSRGVPRSVSCPLESGPTVWANNNWCLSANSFRTC